MPFLWQIPKINVSKMLFLAIKLNFQAYIIFDDPAYAPATPPYLNHGKNWKLSFS